jgi:hypothetical protein
MVRPSGLKRGKRALWSFGVSGIAGSTHASELFSFGPGTKNRVEGRVL